MTFLALPFFSPPNMAFLVVAIATSTAALDSVVANVRGATSEEGALPAHFDLRW